MRLVKIVISIVFTMCISFAIFAQTCYPYDEILRSVEQNNTTLKALAEQAEADKTANRTGISLPDPEVEFGRLWGRPTETGNRTDIAVSQEFDIATATGARLRQAKRQNQLVDLQLAFERTAILLEVEEYCIELIYRNRLAQELRTRLQNARTIADGYRRSLESGNTNRLEYNKTLLNLSSAQDDMARNEMERTALLTELQRLNGGVPVSLEAVDFPDATLPEDFEQWYISAASNNPLMEYARRETEVLRRDVGLARMERLPDLSVGYMREKTRGQNYQGVTIGVSVPLWAGRNSVKRARSAFAASAAREEDSRIQFHGQLRALYERASGLGIASEEYRRTLDEFDNDTLLKKALDAGEISLLDYIVDSGFYYDATNRALEVERDFNLACARLAAYHSIGVQPCETK